MDNNKNSMNGNTNQTTINVSTTRSSSRSHTPIIFAVVIIVIAVIIVIFASYQGYLPLKIFGSSSPYYSVANVQQLSSATAKLENSSGPFNMSYSLLLSLGGTYNKIDFGFNLPVNGYIAHYSSYTRQTANIDFGSLIKDIAALNMSFNTSLFPSFLDTINLTEESNSTGGDLCVPFSMLANVANTPLATIGASLNDSDVSNSSLFCIGIKTMNVTSNITSLLGLLNLPSNSTNLNSVNNYTAIKFVKSATYNGNPCSLLDINTTNAFESKYNMSMGFDFCFSNSYGVPLYGNFMLNLSKDSTVLGSLTNPSLNFSNLVLNAQFKSEFNSAPVSTATLIALPKGSYVTSAEGLQTIVSVEHNLP